MRLYIAGYFVLIAGALLALWQADILRRIPLAWIAIGLIIAVGLGIMLAVTVHPPFRSLPSSTPRACRDMLGQGCQPCDTRSRAAAARSSRCLSSPSERGLRPAAGTRCGLKRPGMSRSAHPRFSSYRDRLPRQLS